MAETATNSTAYGKPLPVLDHNTKPFWDACKEHQLRIQRCKACGTYRFPPGPVCLKCRSAEADWVQASGRGKVYSWIVVRHPIPAEVYASEVPYVVALIELDEGVRMVSNIVECAPEAVKDGQKVQVLFKDVTDKITLPLFKPA